LDLFAAECGSTESDALLALNLSTVPLLASSLSAMGARQDRSSQAVDAVCFPEVLGIQLEFNVPNLFFKIHDPK